MAGHLNRQVGQYPVRAVLADDGHPAACGPALGGKPGGHAAHLIGGFFPRDVLHLAGAHGLRQVNLAGTLTLPAVKALQGQVAV
jgi:hypothetical protein